MLTSKFRGKNFDQFHVVWRFCVNGIYYNFIGKTRTDAIQNRVCWSAVYAKSCKHVGVRRWRLWLRNWCSYALCWLVFCWLFLCWHVLCRHVVCQHVVCWQFLYWGVMCRHVLLHRVCRTLLPGVCRTLAHQLGIYGLLALLGLCPVFALPLGRQRWSRRLRHCHRTLRFLFDPLGRRWRTQPGRSQLDRSPVGDRRHPEHVHRRAKVVW